MNFRQPENYTHAARQACRFYQLDVPVSVSLLQLSENATFLLTDTQSNLPWKVMRVARKGYRTLEEIQAELRWVEHLSRQDKVEIPALVKNILGDFLTAVECGGQTYVCILFQYLKGVHPDPVQDGCARQDFYKTGQIAALLHQDTVHWKESRFLPRPHWDYGHMVGETGLFGNWRECGDLSFHEHEILEETCGHIRKRLSLYRTDEENYGLIHADLRAANLLKDGGCLRVIDFDDCGFGWHIYDLAASLSFVEDHPQAGQWARAWLEGYETVRSFKKDDLEEIPTFIMARRIQLLAWVTTHRDSDPVDSLYPGFAKKTVEMARRYMESGDISTPGS